MINIVNTSFADLGPNSVGLDLSKAVFRTMLTMEEIPTHKALVFIKKEFDLIFG